MNPDVKIAIIKLSLAELRPFNFARRYPKLKQQKRLFDLNPGYRNNSRDPRVYSFQEWAGRSP
jgi:hypothetical protein